MCTLCCRERYMKNSWISSHQFQNTNSAISISKITKLIILLWGFSSGEVSIVEFKKRLDESTWDLRPNGLRWFIFIFRMGTILHQKADYHLCLFRRMVGQQEWPLVTSVSRSNTSHHVVLPSLMSITEAPRGMEGATGTRSEESEWALVSSKCHFIWSTIKLPINYFVPSPTLMF